MPSIDLEVPYQEKDRARALGARWDPRRKVWYVVDPEDLTSFAKWLPQPPRISLRADSFLYWNHDEIAGGVSARRAFSDLPCRAATSNS